MINLTVIDFFCGAGGFSEGFRQQGYKIILGIDNWKPAIDTFNYNFGLDCKVQNVLDYRSSIQNIEELPNTSVIIGSPPCVSFSSSNRSGKADKSMGVTLTETFLRVVAVKKHMPGSVLKGWFMENVAKSISHLQPSYTFKDLALEEWAHANKIDPDKIALSIKDNYTIINSAEYGSPQARRRVILGEMISEGKLMVPQRSHRDPNEDSTLPVFRTLDFVKNGLPKPNSSYSENQVIDPLYPVIKIKQSELSDHFYDTGLYETEWKNSKFLKTNHPYMGIMSFPENNSKPSRTITATKIGTSREAIIYRSEFVRTGNGEYRTPTVREAATIMGFPITFQFIGSEGAKWRLAGNAVCPSVSRSFAMELLKTLQVVLPSVPIVEVRQLAFKGQNLNTYENKKFDNPPKRGKGSRFRRHPFKDGNVTVTLSNYDIITNNKSDARWITSVQYGNGNGFPCRLFRDGYYKEIEPVISGFKNGIKFLEIINNGFTEKIAQSNMLQEMHERQISQDGYLEPTKLIEKIADIIHELDKNKDIYIQDNQCIFPSKLSIPERQVMALYAINKISTLANLS